MLPTPEVIWANGSDEPASPFSTQSGPAHAEGASAPKAQSKTERKAFFLFMTFLSTGLSCGNLSPRTQCTNAPRVHKRIERKSCVKQRSRPFQATP
jgi:hypothetical protein